MNEADRSTKRRLWALAALCAATNTLEAVVLKVVGLSSAVGLAVQANAPAPFGVFHDLRWLIVYQDSLPALVAEGTAMILARGLLTAVTVWLAWPAGLARPAWRTLIVRGIAFTAGAAVLLAPWTALLFGMAVVSISWFFLAAVPAVLVIAALVSHGAVGKWWRSIPPRGTVGWTIVTFAAICFFAALANWLTAVSFLVAAASGVFEAFAWRGLVASVARAPIHRRRLPIAPIGVVAFLAISVVGTAVGFAWAAPAHRGPSEKPSVANHATSGTPVLVAAGYATSWSGNPEPPLASGFSTWRFSYRGLGKLGPLPYSSAETDQSLSRLVKLMSEQVDFIHRHTGRKVDIVAESEASLVAEVYLASHPNAPVKRVVLLSPLISPGRVYYPALGRSGWGMAGGAVLEGLDQVVGPLAGEPLPPRGPFMRSILSAGPKLDDLLACIPRGVRVQAILPLADALAAPSKLSLPVPYVIVPSFHGGLLDEPEVTGLVKDFLEGRSLRQSDFWSTLETAVDWAANAWQVPSLEKSLEPAWRAEPACARIIAKQ
jgi:hypothetical protein